MWTVGHTVDTHVVLFIQHCGSTCAHMHFGLHVDIYENPGVHEYITKMKCNFSKMFSVALPPVL